MPTAKYIPLVALVACAPGAWLGYVALAQTKASDPPVVVPVVVAAVAPASSMAIRTSGLSGDFYVDVAVDKDGKVTSAQAPAAPELMRKAIVEAAKRWQFAPAHSSQNGQNGQPGRTVRLTFSFRHLPPTTSNFDTTPVFYPPYRIEVRDSLQIMPRPAH